MTRRTVTLLIGALIAALATWLLPPRETLPGERAAGQLEEQVPAELRARVTRVHDGDTLTVAGPEGQIRVRVFGIDCPERGQPFAERAREKVTSLAVGRVATVHGIERDRLERLVARVEVDGVDLGEALLEAGLAWHFRRYSDDRRYAMAESAARSAGRGLWSERRPVPPWEWRQSTRR